MEKGTKEIIYLILDIIDAISRTSSQNSFINVDVNKLIDTKNELFKLLLPTEDKDNIDKDIIHDLIGMLPLILVDKKKFPSNNDIVRFAEKSLNLEIPSWEKKSREEIIGRFISQIAAKKPSELKTFFRIWNKFNDETTKEKINTKKPNKLNSTNFVDTWLKFFENYNS